MTFLDPSHCASENEKSDAQQDNLPVPDAWMALFSSCTSCRAFGFKSFNFSGNCSSALCPLTITLVFALPRAAKSSQHLLHHAIILTRYSTWLFRNSHLLQNFATTLSSINLTKPFEYMNVTSNGTFS